MLHLLPSCRISGVAFAELLIQDGASVVAAVCPPGRLVFRSNPQS